MIGWRMVIGAATAACLHTSVAAQSPQFVTIATGGVTGVYFPAGGAICRLVNRQPDDSGLRCSVRQSNGSIQNIEDLRDNTVQFGIAQSDLEYFALSGVTPFEDAERFEGLRAVFALHPEPLTVIVRAGEDITGLDQLKGKRINLGDPGSGQRATMVMLLGQTGWTEADLAKATNLQSDAQSTALCDGDIDAMIYAVGHPSGAVQEATTACDSVILPIAGPLVDQLVSAHPYYRKAVIPGGIYRGNDEDIETFGTGATLLTTENVPEDVVYSLVKSVFDQFDDFRALHPAFADLDAASMATENLSAPLHDGAARYFRERNWIE
jgi:TRAP transporter TAXI family solute receptor